MANTRKKGGKNERRAAELYERAGYDTFRPQNSRFGRRATDILGLFDLLAVPVDRGGPVVLAQVKTNGASGIRAWCQEAIAYASESVRVDFLTRHDGEPGPHTPPGRWQMLRPTCDGEGGYRTVVDERKDGTPPEGEGVVEWLQEAIDGD